MKRWNRRLYPDTFSLLGGEPSIHPDLPGFVAMAAATFGLPIGEINFYMLSHTVFGNYRIIFGLFIARRFRQWRTGRYPRFPRTRHVAAAIRFRF